MIILSDILKDKTFPDSGNVLYNLISNAIQKRQRICIDMEGVVSLPTLFLNSSIGRIIENYGSDELKKSTTFTNISRAQADRIVDYMKKFISFTE